MRGEGVGEGEGEGERVARTLCSSMGASKALRDIARRTLRTPKKPKQLNKPKKSSK